MKMKPPVLTLSMSAILRVLCPCDYTSPRQGISVRARRYEALRQSAEVTAGDLIATLCVSIDAVNPGLSCGEDLLVTPGLDEKIKLLGRRKVRRVVQAVALAGPGPTLVQHRLLALAA